MTLEWDANTEQDLSGYRLHFGSATGTYDATLDVGNATRATVSNLEAGRTYHFVVTAYNTAGLESTPSNEVTFTVQAEGRLPKLQPAGIGYDSGSIELQLVGDPGDSYHVWYSDDLRNWSLLASVENVDGTVLVTDNAVGDVRSRFYRASMAGDQE